MSVCAAVWWANRASVYTSTRKHEITNEIHRNHRNYYITVMDMDTVIQMVIKITSLSQHTIMLGYIYIQSSVMNHLQMNINFLTVGKNINTHTAFNVMVAHDPHTAHTRTPNEEICCARMMSMMRGIKKKAKRSSIYLVVLREQTITMERIGICSQCK